ncbi:TetR/AcrR family transcriptional regulator [Haliea sp. E17]|uniref:TetR/AcrR family transcriptional regulator n=1 Tax=Haliea sp. E17 TaxID=3401576 RepID=UPI003AAA4FF6
MTSSGTPEPKEQSGAHATAKPRVRDRIIDAASHLFYSQGINCVGIDAIVCEADTNKMSLYRNFASKDDLVVQYLKERQQEHFARWDEICATCPDDPRAQLEAIFESFVARGHGQAHCGCPAANAAVELRGTGHAGLEVIHAGRARARQYIRDRLEAAGAKNLDTLTDGLILLLEGAMLSRISFAEQEWPAENMVAALKILLDAELGSVAQAGK